MIEQGERNENQGKESYTNKPHGELVQIFRAAIEKDVKRFRGHMSPEAVVRFRLQHQYGSDERWEFFNTLSVAWATLAYERYDIGSDEETNAGFCLESWYGDTGESAVKLTPLQVKILDALTDALSIPHQRGQAEIPVPEKLRHYSRYLGSPQYKELFYKAQAERGQKPQ